MRALLIMLGVSLAAAGCATYPYADNVKLISFSDNVEKGSSIGNVEGQDCQWIILGYQVKEAPRVDRAISDARKQNNLRYMNNVTTKNSGFNAGVVAKNCIDVTGVGYR